MQVNLNYKFSKELVTIPFADITRKSAKAELVYKFNCKLDHVT